MFSRSLVNIALSYLLDKLDLTRIPDRSCKYALWLLGFSCIIFRVELLLLWIPIALQLLVQGQASFCSLLATNLAAATAASGESSPNPAWTGRFWEITSYILLRWFLLLAKKALTRTFILCIQCYVWQELQLGGELIGLLSWRWLIV